MYSSNMDLLKSMWNTLQELSQLKADFNLTIKLSGYCGQDLEQTALNLLQRVQLNHLKKLLTDFIVPLFLTSNRMADSALVQYIQFLVENRKFMSQWQEKAVLVIEMLTREDDRLQLAILVLDNAPVPWADCLKPLIAYGKSSHPFSFEIVARHQKQVIKMICIRYEYPPNVEKSDTMRLVYRIVKLDRDTMASDLLSMVKVMPALGKMIFMYCISHWIQSERMELALTFFDEFSRTGDVAILFQYFENYFETCTELYMQNVIHFLNIIASRSVSRDVATGIEDLNAVYKLRTCYGIRLGSVNSLSKRREWILDQGLVSIQQEMCLKFGQENVLEQAFMSLVALCQLVKMDIVRGVIQMTAQVNLPAFTFAMASLLLDWDGATVTKSNCEAYIELAVLVLAQVIEHLSQTRHQELPMFPLAYELLFSCRSLAKLDALELAELMPVLRIGNDVYQCLDCFRYYEANRKSLTEEISRAFTKNSANQSDRDVKRESMRKSRRDSYSVFNESMAVVTDEPMMPKKEKEGTGSYVAASTDLVVNCLSVLLEIRVLKDEVGDMSRRFRKYFDADFEMMDLEVLKRGFTQAVNQLYQNKLLWEMHLIIQEMLKAQQRFNFAAIDEKYALALTKKLLGQMLATDEVDIQGKWMWWWQLQLDCSLDSLLFSFHFSLLPRPDEGLSPGSVDLP